MATCCAKPAAAGRTSSAPPMPATARTGRSRPIRSRRSTSVPKERAGRSAAGAATPTTPGAAPTSAARARRCAKTSQTAGIYRYAPGGGAQGPPGAAASPVPLTAGVATFAVAGHAECAEPCADLADEGIAPDRNLTSALSAIDGLAGQPNGPRALLYTGGRETPGEGPESAAEADRYAQLLAQGGGLGVFGARLRGRLRRRRRERVRRRVRGLPGAVWRRRAAGGHQHVEHPGPERARASRRAHPLRLRQHRPHGDGAGDRDRQLARLAGGERPLPEPGRSAGAVAGRDARRRARARHPRDRRGQPRAEPGPAAGAERRDRRERRGADHGGGRRLGVPVRAPGGKPREPDPRGCGDNDPRVRHRRARLPLGDLRLVHARPARRAVRRDRLPARERQRRPAQPRHERRAGQRAADPARAEPVAGPASTGRCCGAAPPRCSRAWPAPGQRRSLGSGVGLSGSPNPPGASPYSEFPPALCLQSDCASAIEPEYTFTSSEPEIANFVEQDPNSTNLRKPLQDSAGHVIPDPKSGILCAFNAGTTIVTISAGGLSYSVPVTVLGGSVEQPCGTVPLAAGRFAQAAAAASASPASPPPPAPAPAPAPIAPPSAARRSWLLRRPAAKPAVKPPPPAAALLFAPLLLPPQSGVPAIPPPPAGAFARPIPPGGATVRVFEEKKEEEEATEQSQAFAAYRAEDYRGLPVGARAYAGSGGGNVRPRRRCICCSSSCSPRRAARRCVSAPGAAAAGSRRHMRPPAHAAARAQAGARHITHTETDASGGNDHERALLHLPPRRHGRAGDLDPRAGRLDHGPRRSGAARGRSRRSTATGSAPSPIRTGCWCSAGTRNSRPRRSRPSRTRRSSAARS